MSATASTTIAAVAAAPAAAVTTVTFQTQKRVRAILDACEHTFDHIQSTTAAHAVFLDAAGRPSQDTEHDAAVITFQPMRECARAWKRARCIRAMDDRDVVVVNELAVLPAARKRGLARALLKIVQAYAFAQRCDRVVWATHDRNEEAAQTWDACGAVRVGRFVYPQPQTLTLSLWCLFEAPADP